MKEGTFNFF